MPHLEHVATRLFGDVLSGSTPIGNISADISASFSVKVEPEGTSELPAASRALFVEKVRLSNAACQAGDYATAVALYTDALTLDPANHILYSNRSAARLKQGQFAAALQDAIQARELCPTWPKAYYRQGVALQCLGRYGEALAAFSSGLAQNPNSRQLLEALIEASLKSPLRSALHPTFLQLQAMKLDQSPFVLISVVGQELLGAGQYHAAVTVLEAALGIGSCSLKLRGSVFSALSSAHWALSQLDKAIGYMQQDLAVAKSLGDTAGECRAHGNLGAAYFSQGSYKEALTAHRYQLVLAMKCKDTQAAAAALTSLGHVYTAIGDYPNALASHKQCVQLVKQMGDRLQEAREIGNVGAVYLAMGEFDSAVDCHTQHLRLARRLGNQVEEARAYSNLGSSHHYRRNFTQAIAFHENVLRIAQNLGDRAVEARAYAGLGHAARCAGDYTQAKRWHERQLDMALTARDKVGEGRACSNLGIVYQLLGEHDAALKLHQAHLSIARALQDRAGMGRAYGNIGNAYSAAGFYEQAIKYHKQELTISKEVHDRNSEASTHGNLAVAYQALGAHDMALLHYRAHLGIARELKDTAGEACALLNLGNCLSSRQEFAQAVPFYEQYLMLSQELGDVAAEAKACHFLGYAHYCIGNYREAVRYYDQDLSLAKELQDKMNMGRAYCNLGLAHLALGQLEPALECQKYFLAIAHMTQHLPGKVRALGNIGDVLVKMGDVDEALNMYQRQLSFARQAGDRLLEASACGALGLGHRLLRKLDKALGYHTQELTLRQELADLSGEARAHGHLGTVHMALANYTHAVKCYQEQLERAQELQDCAVEAQAFGNLGIARLNMGHYEDAIGYLEQQLATLERLSTPTTQLDKARAFGSLGDCYDALGDPEEAVKCHEQHLSLALSTKNVREQERAYRGLGLSHKSLGNLQQALVCLEKRLVVSHELGSLEAKAQAYGELGNIHGSLENLEQAVSCLEHQRNIARELSDRVMESDAVSSLGVVYQQMGDYTTALQYHQMDLEYANQLGITQLQGRACGNLGAVHEALGNLEEAVRCQEQQLDAAGDRLARALALAALGRVHHARGAPHQALAYLRQGVAIADSLGRREDEARIRHRLGIALWACGQAEGARQQLVATSALLVTLRGRARSGGPRSTRIATLQAATSRALQTVLVGLGRQQEALVVAENGRNRSLLDLMLEKQTPLTASNVSNNSALEINSPNRHPTRDKALDVWNPQTIEHILEVVNRQKSTVLYYSLAAGYLYAWLIVPMKGVVRFHQVAINEERDNSTTPNINSDDLQPPSGSVLEHYLQSWRESLQTELQKSSNTVQLGTPGTISETGSTTGVTWERSSQADEMPTDRAGFLRMVNRNHMLNSSNYSLSSLFSVGSVGGSVASLQGSTRSSTSLQSSTRSRKISLWQGPSCMHALYQMLLAPFEDVLPSSYSSTNVNQVKNMGGRKDLVLVLEGDLFFVPFPVLRPGSGFNSASNANSTNTPQNNQGSNMQTPTSHNQEISEYLCERFSLITVPSLSALKGHKISKSKMHSDSQQENGMRCLVVGNPRLPSGIAESWGWQNSSPMQKEALMVGDMLHAHTLTDIQASKEAVLSQISEAECIHLSTHVSWKLSAIVLSPGEMVDSQSQSSKRFLNTSSGSGHSDSMPGDGEEEGSELSTSNMELPPLSEFMLTASDILNLKLSARLVVISCSNGRGVNEGSNSREDNDYLGLIRLCRAILAAGAHCVLLALWPVPETATKILLRAFYSALLQGSRAARALGDAMQTVQHTKHFAHPANWAGFMLIGSNIRLSNKVALMGQALCDLLKTPDKCRDALRVSLHLVEKSLQRIVRGQKNAMYTTQKSIENKVGHVTGWKELLMSVGFRFEPAANGIPSSVFFPQSDPDDRLTQCSASLQALLGLTSTTLQALSKLISNVELADDIISVIRSIISQFSLKNVETESIEITVSVRLWRIGGCHELLASLGCDLMEVGQDDVTLRTGKQANRRNIQFVLQALIALFDTQDAPRSLSLDSSSSLESLASIENNGPEPHSDGELRRATSSPNLGQVVVPPPPLPLSGPRLTQGAFTSYVRHRGEPDGRTAPPPDAPTRSTTNALDCDISSVAFYGNITRISGTATLNISNKFGAVRSDIQHQSYRSTHSKSDFRTNERPPVKISRPGGGGESDAAFTPSPPVVLQRHLSSDQVSINNPNNVTLALAHQTKIRNLYHSTTGANPLLPGERTLGRQNQHQTMLDLQMNTYGITSTVLDNDLKNYAAAGPIQNQPNCSNPALRPDSSSSASSATDWESSGHATVLRRAPLPPLPPPRLPPAPGPLVENLHPLPPVYNNLNTLAGPFGEGNSSDSEFERGFEQSLNTNNSISNPATIQGRNMKNIYKQNAVKGHRNVSQLPDNTLDRLSVRTEIPSAIQSVTSALANLSTTSRKSHAATNIDSIGNAQNNLYYSSTEQGTNNHGLENKTLKKLVLDSDVHGCIGKLDIKSNKTAKDGSHQTSSKQNNSLPPNSGNNSIQDTILASQLRQINRELTPTISEVYHERNIGLGLAPPLSKLLLNQNNSSNLGGNASSSDQSLISGLEKLGIIDENSIPEKDVINIGLSYVNSPAVRAAVECERFCETCKRKIEQGSTLCACKSVNLGIKKASSTIKPWLSGTTSIHSNIQSSDLTTAEIIERQTKIKSQESAAIKTIGQSFSDGVSNTYGTELGSIRHELTKSELIEKDRRDIVNANNDSQKRDPATKRVVSPFSELSKRDEGDGRSIADSHSSYNGVIMNPQNTSSNCHTNIRQTMYMNNPSSEESDTMNDITSNETLEMQNRINKSLHPRTKSKT